MSFLWKRVQVWAGDVPDAAGGVASKLAALAEAGANLEYVFTVRRSDKPGTGVLYVAPLTGVEQVKAAREAGLHETTDTFVIRVEGDNRLGLAHKLTQAWAKAGISFQAMSMAVLGEKFVGYAKFDTVGDANKAAMILADLGQI